MSKSVYSYVVGAWVIAIAVILALAVQLPSARTSGIEPALWFCGLAALGQVLTYARNQRHVSGTVSSLPALTAIVSAPGWEVVLLIGAASLFGEVLARRNIVKAAFNVALSLVAAGVAAFVYYWVTGSDFEFAREPISVVLACFAAASLAHSVVTAGMLAGVIRASEGAPIRTTMVGIFRETVTTDVLTVPFMYVFGRVYGALGGGGVAVLSVPLIGMRQLFVANWQLKQMNEELLELMTAAIEARDPYTSGHSRRVAHYARIIAEGMRLPQKTIDEVSRAALLHDVGKIDEKYAPLLRKPTRLTQEEEALMQTHAARSAELVAKVSYLSSLVGPVRHHHEAWDGTGYPDGLAGERIPLASRIIAFADTIDAMSSERPYRSGLSPDVVRAEIMRCRGTQFDPALTDRVVSADVWRSIFPSAESSAPDPRGLTLVKVPSRRTG